MTRAMSWKPYLWDAPRPVGAGEIALLEREWSVMLPGEYKKLLPTNQGMTPSPCIFNPFAMTSGSEHLCFDYRDSPIEPRIVLVTVEMNVHPVADSFSEFLAQLHE